MDNSKEAMATRIAEWSEKIREREESGMTIPDFCEVYDISVSKYNYWARRIKQAAKDDLPNEIVDVTQLVKDDSDIKNVVAIARSRSLDKKILNVLCLKISSDTPEKLITDTLRSFINV